jgi:hypothetical protein
MEATLIMLDKPILVNEDKPKEFNFVLINNKHIRVVSKEECKIAKNCLEVGGFNAINKDVCKKILAGHEGTKRLTFKLSDEDAKRIGYVNLRLKDEEEQAIKRGGEDYAIGYVEGLVDGLSLTPKKYTEEDMYLLAAKVVSDIAANRGNADWNFFTTPKMIADEFIKQLQPQQFKVECTETENEIIVTKIL